jgi:hypothetical protein
LHSWAPNFHGADIQWPGLSRAIPNLAGRPRAPLGSVDAYLPRILQKQT